MKVYAAITGASSPQRVVDTVKSVIAAGWDEIKGFVVAKATGLAAQAGVPEATRLAYRAGIPLIFMPTLKDAVEVLAPDHVLLITQWENAEPLRRESFSEDSTVLIVVSGLDEDFPRQDLGLGKPYRIPGFRGRLGPAAEMALAIYLLRGGRD